MKKINYLFLYPLWWLFKLISISYRFQYHHQQFVEQALKESPHRSLLFALWHEHIIGATLAHAYQGHFSATSRSQDGGYAAFFAQKLGMKILRGSSRVGPIEKGGKQVIAGSIELLKQGHTGGITVDGPRGPRRQSKKGIVLMAQQTGCPIVPIVAKANSYWQLNSWDQFKIPKPFTRIHILYAAPIFIDQGEIEPQLAKLDHAMAQLDLLQVKQ